MALPLFVGIGGTVVFCMENNIFKKYIQSFLKMLVFFYNGIIISSSSRNAIKSKSHVSAQVAELVDALGSGPSGSNPVEVRVFSWAPLIVFK